MNAVRVPMMPLEGQPVRYRTPIQTMANRLRYSGKYMDLAAETDRLRLEFLAAELDLSFTFARIARFEFESGEREHGKQSLSDADRGWNVVNQLLADPKHSKRLTAEELKKLHERLDQL